VQETIYAIGDVLVDDLSALSPATATAFGVRGYDHLWGDYGPSGIEATRARLLRAKADVGQLPAAADRWDDLARRVLLDYVEIHVSEIDSGDRYRDLNNVASPLQVFRETFDLMPTNSVEGWGDILSRLELLPEALAGYQATLDEGRRRGLMAARRQVKAGIEQAAHSAGADSWFSHVSTDYESLEFSEPEVTVALAGAAAGARAAFGAFAQYLETEYLPDASSVDGVGPERYARAAARFLGTTIDPLDTYQWGWGEVDRLWERMESVASVLDPDATIDEVLARLRREPAVSRGEFVELMVERQRRALAELDGTHFDIPEQIRRVEVKIAPRGGALGAYYTGPSEDFERAGTVWYSFGDESLIPTYDQVSTAYHEGFPGHHLQVGVQVGLSSRVSRFHRMLFWLSGYGEGWALYAERLMDELGYLERPEYEMGFLVSQMLRACRVVIDIGCHLGLAMPAGQLFHPGEQWTFDLGVEMLERYASLERAYAESEVTRYLGWPGQAISYKVGERVILELRDELARRGNTKHKEFHARVLGSGPVGLDHLRELVLEK